MPNDSPRLVSLNEVCEMTTLSRTWVNHLRATDQFPKPVPMGIKRIAFVRAEVEAWIAARIASRNEVA